MKEYQTRYPKTMQYRQAVRNLSNTLSYRGQDDNDEPIYDQSFLRPVTYIGSVKLHGTNANIVLHECGTITLHSRENILAIISPEGTLDLISDNYGFATDLGARKSEVKEIVEYYRQSLHDSGHLKYPMKLVGEWAGPGVQGGVGISQIPNKAFFLFTVRCGEDWVFPWNTDLMYVSENYVWFYNIYDFQCFCVGVDPRIPEKCTAKIEKYVREVESNCPVTRQILFGEGVHDREDLIGEGIVWVPVDPDLYSNRGLWFKTRGEKHSNTKVERLVSVDPEVVESIEKFVEYAVTENRLNQGLEHVALDVKNTGQYIKWVTSDVLQEEGDVLVENNLTMKQVGKHISTKARQFFMSKL